MVASAPANAPVIHAPGALETERAGDVRYRPDIQGYSQDIRKRVRATQHQVELLATARIRDNNTAAQELLPGTLERTMERIATVSRLMNAGYASAGDVRAEYASLAATAIICAEACDRPSELGGLRLRRSNTLPHLRVA